MLFSGNKFQMCPQKFPTLRLHCWSVVAGTKAINSRVYVASVSLQDVRKARKKVLSFFEREISTRKLRQLCRKNFFIEQNKTFFEDRIKLEDFPSIQKKVTQRVIIQIVFFLTLENISVMRCDFFISFAHYLLLRLNLLGKVWKEIETRKVRFIKNFSVN